MTDLSAIDNTGWFKSLVKKITNNAVQTTSTIVEKLEPIIRPAINILFHFATKLIGSNQFLYIETTILNMASDTEGIYHAYFDCWQQYFGYTDLYDVIFDSSTSMRFGKFEFD